MSYVHETSKVELVRRRTGVSKKPQERKAHVMDKEEFKKGNNLFEIDGQEESSDEVTESIDLSFDSRQEGIKLEDNKRQKLLKHLQL